MWRTVKALSQLLVIAGGFWLAVSGAINPTLAFVGILIAYLGTEQLETVLAAVGEEGLNGVSVSVEAGDPNDGDDTTDSETPTAERDREFHANGGGEGEDGP